jgi:hypothetical protein
MGNPNIRIIHELFMVVCTNFEITTVDMLKGEAMSNSKSDERYIVDRDVMILENKSIEMKVRNIMLKSWVMRISPISRGSLWR